MDALTPEHTTSNPSGPPSKKFAKVVDTVHRIVYAGKHQISEDTPMTTKNDRLWARASPEMKAAFIAKAERNGRSPSDVLRELAQAWLDGRVVVMPHE